MTERTTYLPRERRLAGIASVLGALALVFALSLLVGAPMGKTAWAAQANSQDVSTSGAVQGGIPVRSSLSSQSTLHATAGGGASYNTVLSYGWQNGSFSSQLSASTSAFDLTGDGKPDSMDVTVDPSGSAGVASSVVVKVNGKTAATFKDNPAAIDRANVSVITLRNGQPLLFVSTFMVNGDAHQVLFRPNGSKFSKVIGNDLLEKGGCSKAYISDVTPWGDRVVVEFDFTSTITGVSRTSFTCAWNGSHVARTSDYTAALRFITLKSGGYTKQPLKAKRSFTAYTDPSLQTPAFTVPKAKTVRPLGIQVVGSDLRYKVQYGSMEGWVSCSSPQASKVGKLLKGVYGAVPMKGKPAKYNRKKKLSMATLQKLDNHALFLTRNEIYARRGLNFTNGELHAAFAGKSWYKPKASSKVKLNKVERYNVNQILKVEQNRKSPYVPQ